MNRSDRRILQTIFPGFRIQMKSCKSADPAACSGLRFHPFFSGGGGGARVLDFGCYKVRIMALNPCQKCFSLFCFVLFCFCR